jgi:hypothetical protein
MYNQFPPLLEVEMVKKMGPIHKKFENPFAQTFEPSLDDTHSAAPIGYTGVV